MFNIESNSLCIWNPDKNKQFVLKIYSYLNKNDYCQYKLIQI